MHAGGYVQNGVEIDRVAWLQVQREANQRSTTARDEAAYQSSSTGTGGTAQDADQGAAYMAKFSLKICSCVLLLSHLAILLKL